MLAESLLLSAVGAGAGLLLAWWGLVAMRTTFAERLPIARLDQVAINADVLIFTVGAALASALLFGVAPALSSGPGTLTEALKDGGRSDPRRENTFAPAPG